MWRYTYSDELYHYGILGMKWGVRRFQNKDGTRTALGKKRRAEGEEGFAYKAKNGYKKVKQAVDAHNSTKRAKEVEKVAEKRAKITNPKKLTTEELNARIKRLQLEKTYKDLMRDTDSTKRGKIFVLDVMESSGKNLLTQVGNHYGAKALNKVIGEDVIFANNKRK